LRRELDRISDGAMPDNAARVTREIIMLYMKGSLTIDSDKLLAFSGLEKRLSRERLEAKYLVGLWSDSMLLDLIWIPTGFLPKACGAACNVEYVFVVIWSTYSSGRRR
jgi:hypothetical protein